MRSICTALAIGIFAPAFADVALPNVFSDHMVLQQSSKVAVFGTADPGEQVTAVGSWGKSSSTTTGKDGRWSLRLQTPGPGGPFWLKVRGKNSVVFRDVLSGEVWVCSGQSNMWWPLGPRQGMTAVLGGAEEVLASANPKIRLLNVPLQHSLTPKMDMAAKWAVCSPQSSQDFSAIGYFFGKQLHAKLGVPIGLIQSAYGGTPVEQWFRPKALFAVPGVTSLEARMATQEHYDKAVNSVLLGIANGSRFAEPGSQLTGFDPASPETDAEFWKDFDGVSAYVATFELTADQAAAKATLELGAVDDWDLTLVNGAIVGRTRDHSVQRSYSVPAGTLKAGSNRLGVIVVDTGGAAGFQDWSKVRLSVAGTTVSMSNWQRKRLSGTAPLSAIPGGPNLSHSTLWNAMVNPLVPYSIRGAIWYQGESNCGRAEQYYNTFPAMIKDWRDAWGQGDFPFYFVQIAPFAYGTSLSPELRDAQLNTLKTVGKTGMVVVSDLVDNLRDIHPAEKRTVGDRLAAWALTDTYRRQGFPPSGPIYDGFRIEGNKVRIRFDYAQGGLRSKPGSTVDLTIAGEDRKFVPARYEIDGEGLVVWADGVANPKAVRFGWTDTSLASLLNVQGLPASPFRTDNWPLLSAGNSW